MELDSSLPVLTSLVHGSFKYSPYRCRQTVNEAISNPDTTPHYLEYKTLPPFTSDPHSNDCLVLFHFDCISEKIYVTQRKILDFTANFDDERKQ